MATSVTDAIDGARDVIVNNSGHHEVNSRYYESTMRVRPLGPAVPPEMAFLSASIGWVRTYLDSLEERISVLGFRMPNETLVDARLRDWWQANDLDQESGTAHLEAFIQGVCYITVAAPGPNDLPDTPVIRVESSRYMYAKIDPRTREVIYAARFFSDPGTPGNPDDESQFVTVYMPNTTTTYRQLRNGSYRQSAPPIVHNLGIVPVIPMMNRERLDDYCGRSEILPELRSITDMASRILMNLQAAAELMAIPQRFIFGASLDEIAPNADIDPAARYKAYMANILAISAPDGRAGQFTAADLRNFVDALQELAKHFASYTGLPPQYLSFSSDNPASAEAIQASESRLVKKCERKGKMFGNAWERVMRLAIKVMDGSIPKDAYRMEAVLGDPGTPTLAAKADAVAKYWANGTGIIPKRFARKLAGFGDLEIEQMEQMDEEDRENELNGVLAQLPGINAGLNQRQPQEEQ